MSDLLTGKVYPGYSANVKDYVDLYFNQKERNIVNILAGEFYITNAAAISADGSDYCYILMKPTAAFEEATNIYKEIIAIFSRYDTLEARALEAYEQIVQKVKQHRYEKLCYVLISADENVEKNLAAFLIGQENQIIVPFSYKQILSSKNNPYLVRNQFRNILYSRDLFDISEPIKNEIFFFGRADLVAEIITKHHAGQNFALFGLRKTGKTSIILDIMRKSKVQDFLSLFIDCQDTGFSMLRWNRALCYIVEKLNEQIPEEYRIRIDPKLFSEENASNSLLQCLKTISKSLNKTILLLFDEIENITFEKSSVENWCDGFDFIYFWQSIRSIYQRSNNIFTFCIIGTNPKCIETPTFKGKDNPIYNMIQPTYIPGFDHKQTREMVRKLGRFMGIKFDEGIYTRLVEDYGGHPFLMRLLCSKIAKLYNDRPVQIDRSKYSEAKRSFDKDDEYLDMILEVLLQFYPDEYEMLLLLAKEDYKSFNFYATNDNSYVRHLLGYGLVQSLDGANYDFKIDAIKEYLLRKNEYKKIAKSVEEQWTELCKSRNSIEIQLRKMVKAIIKVVYKNESDAKDYVTSKIFAGDKKYFAYSYSDLFDPKKTTIYFKNLVVLINANWEYFTDYFGKQDVFLAHMQILNNEGRYDAHAKIPEQAEMNAVENATRYVKDGLNKYFNENY